jgi:hypothetical protein
MTRIHLYLPRLILPAAFLNLLLVLASSQAPVSNKKSLLGDVLSQSLFLQHGGSIILSLLLLGIVGSFFFARKAEGNSCYPTLGFFTWLSAYAIVSALGFWLAFSGNSSCGSQCSALLLALGTGWCGCSILDDIYGFRREERVFVFRDLLPLLTIFLAGLLFGLLGINSTFHTGIGDEGSFFEAAYDLAKRGLSDPFRWNGVYGKFPWFDSILQSFGLTLISADIRGWRSIPIAAVALGGSLLYVFSVLWLNNRAVGLWAGMMLISSHMLGAFALIGYNNVHFLLSAMCMLNVAAWYYLAPRPSRAYVLGATIGLSSYIIWGAAHVIPLVGLIAALAHSRLAMGSAPQTPSAVGRGHRVLVHIACFLPAIIIALLPGFLRTPHDMLLTEATDITNWSRTPINAAHTGWMEPLRMVQANFSSIWFAIDRYTHFVLPPITDRITGALFALGIFGCLLRARNPKYVVVLLWPCAVMLAIVLTLVPGTPPYFTRLVMIIPSVCLIAAIAAADIQHGMRLHRTAAGRVVVIAVLTAVFLLNYHRLHIEVPATQRLTVRGLFAKLGTEYPHARLVSVRSGPETDFGQMTLMKLFPYLQNRVSALPNTHSVPLAEPSAGAHPTLYIWTDDTPQATAHLERFSPKTFQVIAAKHGPTGPFYLVFVARYDLAKLQLTTGPVMGENDIYD